MSPLASMIGLLMIAGGAHATDRDLVRVRLLGPAAEMHLRGQKLSIISNKGEVVGAAEGESVTKLRWDDKRVLFILEVKEAGWKLRTRELTSDFPLRFQVSGGLLEVAVANASPGLVARTTFKRVPEKFDVARALGQIEAVAKVPFGDYLMGVLHREMPGKWPLEALKAQAVATRSYTLAQMKDRRGATYDLDASVMDQEFEYIPETDRGTEINRRWAQALRESDSTILLNSKDEILKAYYHADCGGRTTTPDFVWGPVGEYKSVRDPACEKRAQNQWKMVAKKTWLRAKLGGEDTREPAMAHKAGLKFDWVQSLFDQRVTLVEWWDGLGDLKVLSGQNFRQLLGFGELRSLRFETKDLGDAVEFRGRGFGHGVGLCQWGSKDWAEKGLSSEEILRHYYPLSHLGRR